MYGSYQPSNFIVAPCVLDVPFDRRHEARALGAVWDSGQKVWMAPAAADKKQFVAKGFLKAEPASSIGKETPRMKAIRALSGMDPVDFIVEEPASFRPHNFQSLEVAMCSSYQFVLDSTAKLYENGAISYPRTQERTFSLSCKDDMRSHVMDLLASFRDPAVLALYDPVTLHDHVYWGDGGQHRPLYPLVWNMEKALNGVTSTPLRDAMAAAYREITKQFLLAHLPEAAFTLNEKAKLASAKGQLLSWF